MARGKRDNDDQQCPRLSFNFALAQKEIKTSQPVKIKAKACANKYARYISYQCYFKRFIEVFNARL